MLTVVLPYTVMQKVECATDEEAGFKFNKNHCYSLLKNLIQVHNLNKDVVPDGYVMLCSEHLQKISHEYRFYLSWMESKDIIQIDYSYQIKSKCRYYKLITDDVTNINYGRDVLMTVTFESNSSLTSSVTNVQNIFGISFLVDWLNQITIDDQLANDLNWSVYQQDKVKPRVGYKEGMFGLEPYHIIPLRAYNFRKDNVKSINKGRIYATRDTTSGRLHTSLTGLSSKIFPALRFKGKHLVGYDIANSQPFLTSVIINSLLISYQLRQNELKKEPLPSNHSLNPLITNTKLNNYLYKYTHTHPPYHTIMLEDFLSDADFTGVLEFQLLCKKGHLYPVMSQNIFGLEYVNDNKRVVKDLFFTLFFTKPKNNKKGIPKFKKQYPGVHKIISAIKDSSEEGNYFPVLLQSLESYYILEVVCKSINKRYKNIPLFTKHDSIYTTEEYLPIIKSTLEEEALNLFGLVPSLNLT